MCESFEEGDLIDYFLEVISSEEDRRVVALLLSQPAKADHLGFEAQADDCAVESILRNDERALALRILQLSKGMEDFVGEVL